MQMTEKLQDTENEAMAKIVELEKQLMHKNKELDSIRVRVFLPLCHCLLVFLELHVHITNSAEQTEKKSV